MEPLRDIAKRIMEISNEAQLLQKERDAIRQDRDRRVQHSPQVARASFPIQEESGQKEGEKEGETFKYNFQVSY